MNRPLRGGTGLNRGYIEEWRRLLSRNDVDRVELVVSGDGDLPGEMRNLSPLTWLLSDDERQSVREVVFGLAA